MAAEGGDGWDDVPPPWPTRRRDNWEVVLTLQDGDRFFYRYLPLVHR
jgi:hypothetical protein